MMARLRMGGVAFVVVAMGLGLGTAGCGGGSSDTGEPALVEIQNSSIFITVENRAGQPLTEMKVSVVPVGGVTLFTASLARLESGEKRDLSLSQFYGRDGTPLDLRVVRPKAVRVSAKKVDGTPVEVEKPWR